MAHITQSGVESRIARYGEIDARRISGLPAEIFSYSRLSELCFALTTGLFVELSMRDGSTFADPAMRTRFFIACILGLAGVLMLLMQLRKKRDLEEVLSASPFELYQHIRVLKETIVDLQNEVDEGAQRSAGQQAEIESLEEELLADYSWVTYYQYVNACVHEFVDYIDDRSNHEFRSLPNAEKRLRVQSMFSTVLGQIVEALAAQREELLGYEEDEVFFIDVFELRDDNFLYRIARRKSDGAESHDRRWAVGRGNVGACIAKAAPVFAPYNPADTDHNKPRDREYFKSVIVCPVRAVDRKPHKAYGAICVTSSNKDRLSPDEIGYIDNLSHCLAPAFYARGKALMKWK